jgi:FkbM family methyltransferase
MSTLVGEKGQVIAFEPEPNNSSCLEATIKLNAIQNLRLEKKAVGRITEQAIFDGRGGAFSGRLVDHGKYKTTSNVTQVDVVSLDDLVKLGFPAPDLIKIDVEGNELMVLEGMKNMLGSNPPIVLCEIHSYLGDPSKKVVDLLTQYDYELFEVDSMAAGKLSPITDLKGRDWLIACPRVKRSHLVAA